jgi:hypothetical protein
VLYFHNSSKPLELGYIEELGLAILCSERKFLTHAIHVYRRARLTLKRGLPTLTLEWRNIPDNKGGVIDVATPFEDDSDVDTLFPLVDCKSVDSEYKAKTTTTTVTRGTTHGWNNYNTESGTPTTTGNTYGSQTGASNKQKEESKKKPPPPANKVNDTAKTEANIVDLSDLKGYGADIISSENESCSVTQVPDSAVMDDVDNEDNPACVSDVYDDDELQRRGVDYAFSEEARQNEALLINKDPGEFKDLLASPKLEAEEAAEIMHAVYPDIFGEGFSVGFKAGAQEQEKVQSGEDSSKNDFVAVVKCLREDLIEAKAKQRRAAVLIANIKAFLMGVMAVTGRVGQVVGKGENARLIFDEEVEEFLRTAEGFEKFNPALVRSLFEEKDLRAVAEGITRMARKVSDEHEEAQKAAL